ncbi:MAG: cytochrome c3 family protein, partial [Magnetococcales bacterium]|nr:cytochrome c3 family protein [Magnetococcales bacterium]
MNKSFRIITICCWLIFPFLAPTLALSGGSESGNRDCLACHDDREQGISVSDTSPYAQPGERRSLVGIARERYAQGVHGRMGCADCHNRIATLEPPHQPGRAERIDCATCHGKRPKNSEALQRNLENYRLSLHARPNQDHPESPNATCHECHDSHFFKVPTDKRSPEYASWRLTTPQLCGRCHEDQLERYAASVH